MPDNNAAERGMRAVTLGRKNYRFVGSEAAGKAAAIACTLIATAKPNAVEPDAWLDDTHVRVHGHRINKIDKLLPGERVAASPDGHLFRPGQPAGLPENRLRPRHI